MAGEKTYDRIRNFGGGVDAYRPASELEPNQSQLMENMLVRDNYEARTRPGADALGGSVPTNPNLVPNGATYAYIKHPPSQYGLYTLNGLTPGNQYRVTFALKSDVSISDGTQFIQNTVGVGYSLVVTSQTATWTLSSSAADGSPVTITVAALSGSAVQSLFFYSSPSNTPGQLLCVEGGAMFSWNNVSWSAALAGFASGGGETAAVAMAQGVDKVLISDGTNPLQIYDGNAFTDATGAGGQLNAPKGATILCWAAGRMIASGIVATPDTVYVSNLLAFGQGQWNSATQSFRIGNGDGESIVGISPYFGFQVVVLKENSIWLMNLDPSLPINQWQAQPQGDPVGTGIGCVGKNAFCRYENDLLFMSQDGVQSLQRMQAAAGQYQLSQPLSLPIQPYIDRIHWNYAYLIQAVKYRHLALFLVPLDNSQFNNCVLVWNGRLRQWTGIFTGWTPVTACVTRFNEVIQLAIGSNDGTVNLWKDSPTALNTDSTYLDNGVPITTTLTTRALIFGNFDLPKQASAALFRFNAGNATINCSATTDLNIADTWTSGIAPSGSILPAILPFTLASNSQVESFRELNGLQVFNELAFMLQSKSGWWAIRNVTAESWLQALTDPNT